MLVKRTVFQTGMFRRVDIPSELETDALEEKVVFIFEELGCNIPNERIEACHRISKKNTTAKIGIRIASRFGMSREACEK